MDKSAYHESGHGLICSALGGRVEAITIEPNATLGTLALTYMRYGLDPAGEILMLAGGSAGESFAPVEEDDSVEQQVLVESIAEQQQAAFIERFKAVVSPATAAQLTAEDYRGIASDYLDGFNEKVSDRGKARVLARQLGVETDEAFEQLWQTAVDAARAMLAEQRALLDKVAHALIQKRTLCATDLAELGLSTGDEFQEGGDNG